MTKTIENWPYNKKTGLPMTMRESAFVIFLNFIFGIGLLAAKMSYLIIKTFFPRATDEEIVDKNKFEE